jgi:hypothetical protein
MTRKTNRKTSAGTARPKAVRPFYSHLAGLPSQPRNSMTSDFESVPTAGVDEAARRWRSFLRKFEPPSGEFQDAFQQKRVRAAQFELMRLEYLRGNVKAGDRLLAKLQDLQDLS